MKIVKLIAQNVKKLKAVEITPNGSMVVVGGKNAAGKSSVLDAIMAALAGKKSLPPKMLREGQKKGYVEIDLDQYTVKRTFTQSGGGTLKITNKDGAVFPSPQCMLDKLIGDISFDPLRFVNMDSRHQVELLKQVSGLDFDELDEKRAELYEKRRDVNRDIKREKLRVTELKVSLPDGSDTPERVSVQGLMKKLQEAQDYNSETERMENKAYQLITAVSDQESEIASLEKQLEKAKADLSALKEEAEKAQNEFGARRSHEYDVDKLKEKINSAEKTNALVQQIEEHEQAKEKTKALTSESDSISEEIQSIDTAKQEQITNSNLPVNELSFDSAGVQYRGLPFEQASQAEQLQVSVALGLAANPKLKVLLIKDGSLLDEENLKLIADMADENDAQIWLERVGAGKEVSMVLEDGKIQDAS